MKADGTDHRQLADNHIADGSPDWSLDDQTIAYCAGFPLTLYLINAEGGNPQPLIDGKEGLGLDGSPAWSAAGFHLGSRWRLGNLRYECGRQQCAPANGQR